MSDLKRVWEARTGAAPDEGFLAYSQSVAEDAPFVPYDIAGSIAHVLGLATAGLVTDKEALALVQGLQRLADAAAAGQLALEPALEDVHMNVEARLGQLAGDVAKKVHTGRSRNDQVALDIVLFARGGLCGLARASHALAASLAKQAQAHADTPWVARTHGQPAQPATLGFLLLGHAFRFHDLAARALQAFDRVGESPLGAGAVAGSTLALRPDVTARLLGLRVQRNALLATGTRDAVVETCQLAAAFGIAASSLSQDLLDLVAARAAHIPSGFTTGSSLMPHKRNPDALELARAKGKALVAPAAAVTAVVAGLGLGYHRDFQVTKPHLVAALKDATETAHLLARVVEGTTFDVEVLRDAFDAPGITATDVAEALVASGVPFRTAYTAVAQAYAMVEHGEPFATAIAGQGLPPAAVRAAMHATQPDPTRRATIGGPAPVRVHDALATLRPAAVTLEAALSAARTAADVPLALLAADPLALVQDLRKENI